MFNLVTNILLRSPKDSPRNGLDNAVHPKDPCQSASYDEDRAELELVCLYDTGRGVPVMSAKIHVKTVLFLPNLQTRRCQGPDYRSVRDIKPAKSELILFIEDNCSGAAFVVQIYRR